jgi:hypothetical protein
VGTVVVTLVMLLVVALWWHCSDTVVIVVVTVFIVVALGRPVVTAGESGRPCDGVWSSRDSRTVRFLM